MALPLSLAPVGVVLLLLAACGGATTEGGEAEPVEARPACPVVAACDACTVELCSDGAFAEYRAAGYSWTCHTASTCADAYPLALAACGATDDGAGLLCPNGTSPRAPTRFHP